MLKIKYFQMKILVKNLAKISEFLSIIRLDLHPFYDWQSLMRIS